MLTLDQGKPLRAEAYEEVHELIAFWHLAAEDAVRLEGVIPPSSFSDKRVLVMRRARGPIGVITPWNWPYTMPAELIAPALRVRQHGGVDTGPIDRRLLRPAGRMRCRGGPSGGGVQLRDRTWTGGGRRDRRKPGDGRSGLHRLDPDRPPGGAARGREGTAARNGGQRPARRDGRRGPRAAVIAAAIVGCFLCAGQSCTASERLLVHKNVREEFGTLLAKAVSQQILLGDPFDAATTMGPLNNEATAAKMDEHVADAVERGAAVLTGGNRVGGFPTDLYWAATVLDRSRSAPPRRPTRRSGRSPPSSRSLRSTTRSR